MGGKNEKSKQSGRQKKSIGTMDKILVVIFICLVIFTAAMIWIFTVYGSVPDTLVTCVFTVLGGECGIMGWIKTTKEKRQDRKWQQEDRQQEREDMERAMQQADNPPDNP